MPIPFIAAAACCIVSGFVHSVDGAPILKATIAIDGGSAVSVETTNPGHFTLGVGGGPHRVAVVADGYAAATINNVIFHEGSQLNFELQRLDTNELRNIGRVTVDGRSALSTATVPSVVIRRSFLDDEGLTHVTDALEQLPSATIARPDSGAPSAVSVVALRGPDPSETLIALDGQVLNNTNTGDLDLSQFPVSPFRSIEVTEGLGPENATAANTIGGEVNLQSLSPTRVHHAMASFSSGTFDSTSLVANATGIAGRLGYAFAYGNATTQGPVGDRQASFLENGGESSRLLLNSGVTTRTALENLQWTFSQATDLRIRYFTIANARDESGALNGVLPDGSFSGPGRAFITQGIRALQVSGRTKFGPGSLLATFSSSGTTNTYDGGPTVSPYEVSQNDRLQTVSLEWQRSIADLALAFGGYSRNETLAISNVVDGVIGEHSEALYARAGWNVTPYVRLLANGYDTRYSTFGASLDGRLGAILAVGARSNVRASVGTGFRAPLLAELYVTPLPELEAGLPGSVDANCVAANGNANERPEHVTTYEFGYSRQVDPATTVDITAYRTNLRNPIELAYPLGSECRGGIAGSAIVGQVIPINISNAVYKGATARIGHRFGSLSARLEYGINIAYPRALPQTVANPTSGANLVENVQFQGIPIHVATLGVQYRRDGYHADVAATYRGINNELNAGPYVAVNGAVGKTFGAIDIALAFTNLTNAFAGPFTHLGAGVPYATPSGALPTDLFLQQPATINFVISVRR